MRELSNMKKVMKPTIEEQISRMKFLLTRGSVPLKGERFSAIQKKAVAVEKAILATLEAVPALVKALEEVEFGSIPQAGSEADLVYDEAVCPICETMKIQGHKPGCLIAAALAPFRDATPATGRGSGG